ncbi:carboxypeptidase-like regulatory domain-containing protein [Mangrovimonas futianensis]|uniref:carboxypeptidase-like regulatory domain-containing protein n=1 Tax=Mangrovimonas futianensis TaxID=2895523 RepID=UPI001E64CBF9|nr:carboxypeptidase-like regulatory domain-containing protein [Mangrovimonas futianensis]MCF1420176.1 carboxypeptidase-like regulatory domain-containing protein [Mangrovimonas futianensis]
MKQLLLFTFFLITISAFSQGVIRKEITGQVVSNDNDVEGVTIYNKSTSKGTITDQFGEFTLLMGEGDIIEISALQYTPVSFPVAKETMITGVLKIWLTEQVNSLNEVYVFSSELTGNLGVDVDSVKVMKIDPLGNLTLGDVRNMNFPTDHLTKVDNFITRQGQFYNGVDFAALLSVFFKKKSKPLPKHQELKREDQIVDISEKYTHAFITQQFHIPEDQIEAFYSFCYEKGFDADLLKDENEVELIEYMVKMSEKFRGLGNGED